MLAEACRAVNDHFFFLLVLILKITSFLFSFRVVSYNLLAEVYSDTDFAKEHLFHYCPYEVLEMDYRKHLFLKEIVGEFFSLL